MLIAELDLYSLSPLKQSSQVNKHVDPLRHIILIKSLSLHVDY